MAAFFRPFPFESPFGFVTVESGLFNLEVEYEVLSPVSVDILDVASACRSRTAVGDESGAPNRYLTASLVGSNSLVWTSSSERRSVSGRRLRFCRIVTHRRVRTTVGTFIQSALVLSGPVFEVLVAGGERTTIAYRSRTKTYAHGEIREVYHNRLSRPVLTPTQ